MNLYQRLLTLTDEAITTLRTIQETQAVALRAHVAAQRASEASESAAIFRDAAWPDALRSENLRLQSDIAKVADLLGVEPDDDLAEAVEILKKRAESTAPRPSRWADPQSEMAGMFEGRRVQRLSDAALLREKAETVQPVAWFSAVSTAAVICWCAYLIDTTDEVPLTLQEWLSGRGKS